MPAKPRKLLNWKTIVNIVTILALIILVYSLQDQIVETFRNLQNVNLWVLLLMIPLQLLNYHAYAKMYDKVFTFMGNDVPYRKLFRVQLELNFVNHVFPSGGVTGMSYFSFRLRDEGVSAGKSTLVQLFKFALLFVSIQILLFIGLIALSFSGQASSFLILITSSLITLLAVGTIMGTYIVGSKQRVNSFAVFATRGINRLIRIFRPRVHETISLEKVRQTFSDLHDNYILIKGNYQVLKKPLAYAFLANVTEVLSVYIVYVAFGQWINPGAVVIAYAVSNFAGLISVLPGGIGIYEALMTAVLAAAGIPAALSLPVTIMYRILSSLIQLPPGYFFYHKALNAPVQTNEE